MQKKTEKEYHNQQFRVHYSFFHIFFSTEVINGHIFTFFLLLLLAISKYIDVNLRKGFYFLTRTCTSWRRKSKSYCTSSLLVLCSSILVGLITKLRRSVYFLWKVTLDFSSLVIVGRSAIILDLQGWNSRCFLMGCRANKWHLLLEQIFFRKKGKYHFNSFVKFPIDKYDRWWKHLIIWRCLLLQFCLSS